MQSFSTEQSMILKDRKNEGPLSIDYRERGSHALGVYPTQYTSRVGTERVKQKVETDKNNERVVRNLEKKERGHEG